MIRSNVRHGLLLCTLLTVWPILFIYSQPGILNSDFTARADSFLRSGETDKAVSLILKQLHSINPELPVHYLSAFNWYGQIYTAYHQAGNYAESERAFNHLIDYALTKNELLPQLLNLTLKHAIEKISRQNDLFGGMRYLAESRKMAARLQDAKASHLVDGGYSIYYLYCASASPQNRIYQDSAVHFLKREAEYFEKMEDFNQAFTKRLKVAEILHILSDFTGAEEQCRIAKGLLGRTSLPQAERLMLDSLQTLMTAKLALKQGQLTKLDSSILMWTDPDFRARSFQDIAWLHIEEGLYDEALSICRELEAYYAKTGELFEQGATAHLISKIYIRKGLDSLAFHYLTQAFEKLISDGRYNDKITAVLVDFSVLNPAAHSEMEGLFMKAMRKFQYDGDGKHLAQVYRLLGAHFLIRQERLRSSYYFEQAGIIETRYGIMKDKYYPAQLMLNAVNLVENGAYQEAAQLYPELASYRNSIEPVFRPTYILGISHVKSKVLYAEDGRLTAIAFLVEQMGEIDDPGISASLFQLMLQFGPGPEFAPLIRAPLFELIDRVGADSVNGYVLMLKMMVFPDEITAQERNRALDLSADIAGIFSIPEKMSFSDQKTSCLSVIGMLIYKLGVLVEQSEGGVSNHVIGLLDNPVLHPEHTELVDSLRRSGQRLVSMLLDSEDFSTLSEAFERLDQDAAFWQIIYTLGVMDNDAELMLLALEASRSYYLEGMSRVKNLYNERGLLKAVRQGLRPSDMLLSIQVSNQSESVTVTAISQLKAYQFSISFGDWLTQLPDLGFLPDSASLAQETRGIVPSGPVVAPVLHWSGAVETVLSDKAKRFNSILFRYRQLLARMNRSADEERWMRKVSSMLYFGLLENLLRQLPETESIFVIANGQFAALPLETLLDSNGIYLIESVAIHYQSSIYSPLKHNTREAAKEALFVGISDFESVNGQHHMDCEEAFDTRNAVRKWLIDQVEQQRSLACMFSGWHFYPIPNVRKEINQISTSFKGARTLLDSASDEGAVKRSLLSDSNYSVLHFATHATYYSDIPELSALVLNPARGEDGYLTLLEVSQMELTADLVVLSACETNLGYLYEHTGSFGLPQAFMQAGANRVVSSLWKVDDLGTQKLMSAFYNGLDQAGVENAAGQLRKVKLDFIRGRHGEKFQDPFYWAAFVELQ